MDFKAAALCVKKYRQMYRELSYEFKQEIQKHIGKVMDWDLLLDKPTVVYQSESPGIMSVDDVIFIGDKDG